MALAKHQEKILDMDIKQFVDYIKTGGEEAIKEAFSTIKAMKDIREQFDLKLKRMAIAVGGKGATNKTSKGGDWSVMLAGDDETKEDKNESFFNKEENEAKKEDFGSKVDDVLDDNAIETTEKPADDVKETEKPTTEKEKEQERKETKEEPPKAKSILDAKVKGKGMGNNTVGSLFDEINKRIGLYGKALEKGQVTPKYASAILDKYGQVLTSIAKSTQIEEGIERLEAHLGISIIEYLELDKPIITEQTWNW
jgi:hypothetical protein